MGVANFLIKVIKMQQQLMNPWRVEERGYRVTVSVIELDLQHPWPTYLQYDYVHGVDTKLSRIPQHCWGLKNPGEELYRVPRVAHFVDVTGCTPAPSNRKTPKVFHQIHTVEHLDHVTYWHGPNGEPFVLAEPYWPRRAKLEVEIAERGLCAAILPAPGLYAGGDGRTTSVLMGLPEHRANLLAIVTALNLTGWPPMPKIRDVDWIEATRLSKAQARGVAHA